DRLVPVGRPVAEVPAVDVDQAGINRLLEQRLLQIPLEQAGEEGEDVETHGQPINTCSVGNADDVSGPKAPPDVSPGCSEAEPWGHRQKMNVLSPDGAARNITGGSIPCISFVQRDSVASAQFSKLVLERNGLMVLDLSSDVSPDFGDL